MMIHELARADSRELANSKQSSSRRVVTGSGRLLGVEHEGHASVASQASHPPARMQETMTRLASANAVSTVLGSRLANPHRKASGAFLVEGTTLNEDLEEVDVQQTVIPTVKRFQSREKERPESRKGFSFGGDSRGLGAADSSNPKTSPPHAPIMSKLHLTRLQRSFRLPQTN